MAQGRGLGGQALLLRGAPGARFRIAFGGVLSRPGLRGFGLRGFGLRVAKVRGFGLREVSPMPRGWHWR